MTKTNKRPLGATPLPDGVYFALYAPKAKEVTLGIFVGGNCWEHPLEKREDRFEIHLPPQPKEALYAFKLNAKWLADPFAKELARTPVWGKGADNFLAKVYPDCAFDWEDDVPLNLPFSSLILYEMHVRGFTSDASAQVDHPGTFLGVIEKIPYLQKLGVNAVELLPIFSFDETDHNYWGYSTNHFFTPMPPYGTITECKKMIKALHAAGIEVILDVVYNHVGTDLYAQIDPSQYFILGPKGEHTNYTGCGNTINCNAPHVIELILSSLCYFVEEFHVDGFRFDLASIFMRGEDGEVLEKPPILQAIEKCTVLKNTKLIAEPWDCAGLYQVGMFPSQKFAEWNGQFRDRVRRFLKGSPNSAGPFAAALCGSADLYEGTKAPYQSIQFVTAHDGFTLMDLVSYNHKHNEENGEGNRDGCDHNESWNCGHEGETDDPAVLSLRERQMRNFLLSLFMAVGTPMLHMGDEYGHTRDGNNNAYQLDNGKNYFHWQEHEERIAFVSSLIKLRKSLPILQRTTFLSKELTWHTPSWDGHLVAYMIEEKGKKLFLAFNAQDKQATLSLPPGSWTRKVDTFQSVQTDEIVECTYLLEPYSSLLLLS